MLKNHFTGDYRGHNEEKLRAISQLSNKAICRLANVVIHKQHYGNKLNQKILGHSRIRTLVYPNIFITIRIRGLLKKVSTRLLHSSMHTPNNIH